MQALPARASARCLLGPPRMPAAMRLRIAPPHPLPSSSTSHAFPSSMLADGSPPNPSKHGCTCICMAAHAALQGNPSPLLPLPGGHAPQIPRGGEQGATAAAGPTARPRLHGRPATLRAWCAGPRRCMRTQMGRTTRRRCEGGRAGDSGVEWSGGYRVDCRPLRQRCPVGCRRQALTAHHHRTTPVATCYATLAPCALACARVHACMRPALLLPKLLTRPCSTMLQAPAC